MNDEKVLENHTMPKIIYLDLVNETSGLKSA